jgi:hypothetical protein
MLPVNVKICTIRLSRLMCVAMVPVIVCVDATVPVAVITRTIVPVIVMMSATAKIH